MHADDVLSLGLGVTPPWKLVGQRLDTDKRPNELHIEVAADRGTRFPCPDCDRPCKAHDFDAFTWRHLNFFQHHCYVTAKVPRTDCPDHGVKRLLAVVAQDRHAHRNRLAVMLSHFAGLRVGEIAHLRVRDVVDANGKVRDQIQLRTEFTKGDEARTVFVSERLRRELDRFFQAIQSRPALDAPLLRTQKRTAFSPNTLCQWFTNLYRRAGIEGATSHSGRRWFITRLAHAGVSPKVIMTLAGHKHLTTTQRYIDVNDEMLRRAVEVP